MLSNLIFFLKHIPPPQAFGVTLLSLIPEQSKKFTLKKERKLQVNREIQVAMLHTHSWALGLEWQQTSRERKEKPFSLKLRGGISVLTKAQEDHLFPGITVWEISCRWKRNLYRQSHPTNTDIKISQSKWGSSSKAHAVLVFLTPRILHVNYYQESMLVHSSPFS